MTVNDISRKGDVATEVRPSLWLVSVIVILDLYLDTELNGLRGSHLLAWSVPFTKFWHLAHYVFVVWPTFVVNVHKTTLHFFATFNFILKLHSQIM